jgi:FG-GAP repeat
MTSSTAGVIHRLILLVLGVSLASAAWAGEGRMAGGSLKPLATLTASDAEYGAVFGAEVAVSGNVVAVGAPEQSGGEYCFDGGGAIYVYEKPANGWQDMAQTAELTSNASCMMVLAAFSGDTIVATELGCTGDGFYETGAIFVFVKPEGGWTNMEPTATLSISGVQGCNVDFALSAAINQEQNLIVAGVGPHNDLFVYQKPEGGWANTNQPSTVIKAPTGSSDEFGFHLALDGSVLAVGDEEVSPGGAVYVFNLSETVAQPLATLTPSNPQIIPGMGFGVAIAGDTIIAGSPLANSDQGIIYVFEKPAAGWSNMTETAQLSVANIPSDFAILGENLALNPAGNEVVSGFLSSGSPDPLGYVFLKPAGGWQTTSSPSDEIFANGSGEPGNIDSAVAVSQTNIVLGAGGTNDEAGAAFVFAH